MDNALQPILELIRDPILALADGRIALMNAAARKAFPTVRVGDGAFDLIPDLIVFAQAEQFISTVKIDGVRYTAAATRMDGTLFLSLTPEASAAENRGYVSDGLMSGMLTALYNIRLSADRLHDTLPSGEASARTYLAMLNHSYYSLLRRLRDLNALYALNEGSMDLMLRRVDLVKLCTDVASSTALLTRGTCARLEFSTELETLTACMDARMVEHLILNLLSNSLKHTPPDGLVRLKLAQRASNALISVSDNGSGIPPVQLKNVFSSFQNRLDLSMLSAEPGGGIGLGLCRAIAERHGGTLILESREGEGTDVRVLLPLSQPGVGDLESAVPEGEWNSGMSAILTELSDLLDSDVYADCGAD